jgi:ferrochelatase
LPLYPQYSGATTGSVFDAVADRLRRQRFVPELRFINDYHADPGYIDALAESVRAFWATNGPSEYLLISFHGLPRRNCETGDPYAIRCAETTRRLAERLGLPREQWEQTYQSRFGPQRWLEPYLDSRLRSLPAAGKRQIDILCPGFAVDCLETLEEVAVRGKETFIAAGGERLRYIPALNDTTRHVQVLADLIRHNLAGWPDSAGD